MIQCHAFYCCFRTFNKCNVTWNTSSEITAINIFICPDLFRVAIIFNYTHCVCIWLCCYKQYNLQAKGQVTCTIYHIGLRHNTQVYVTTHTGLYLSYVFVCGIGKDFYKPWNACKIKGVCQWLSVPLKSCSLGNFPE